MKKMEKLMSSLLIVALLLTTVPVLQMSVQAAPQEENVRLGYEQLTKIDLGETDEEIVTPTLESNRYAASTWDIYSSKYFYNQMNSGQKQLYNSLYNLCMAYLTTSQDAQTYNSNTGLTAPVIAPSGLSQNDASQVIFVMITNNPQFYFLNEMWAMGTAANGNYVQVGIYPEWVSGATRASSTSQMSEKINAWMSQINAQPTIVKKEQKAHDLVVENTTYAYADYDQSCAGVFLQGKAVCAGYAEAFALLCNGIGINTISVTSAEHEWNIVQLYGNWYNVDCTWDDQDDGITYYDYLNVSDKKIGEGYHVVEDSWSGLKVPSCSSDTIIYPEPIYNGVNYAAVYNEEYYVTQYADVRNAYGTDSNAILAHFVNFGMREGRQGISTFNVISYKNQYVDLRNAYGNNLKSYYLHYLNFGKREGRIGTGCTTRQGAVTVYNGVNYSAVYDYDYYVNRYSDVRNAFGSDDIAAIAHFVNYGMREGRQGSANFDVYSYINKYADLRAAFGNNLKSYYLHYLNFGKREGRIGTGCTNMQGTAIVYNGINYSGVYDYNYYLNKYPDIKKAFGIDDKAALAHFVNYGMREGRQGSSEFNVYVYRDRYTDVQRAYGDNLKSYYLHYLNFGMREGRSGK